MGPLLVTGLLGSFHCAGMCGGFVLALDRPGRVPWRRIRVQGLFHLGKASTYVVLGGLVGLFGAALVRAPWFSSAQVVLTVVAEMVSLVPGSLVVEARRSTHTLFLHVLDARDQDGVERMRREVLALERRVVLAFGADTAPVVEPEPLPVGPHDREEDAP